MSDLTTSTATAAPTPAAEPAGPAAEPGRRDHRRQTPLWRLSGRFRLLTPLHIGTGQDEPITLDEGLFNPDEELADTARHVATVVRDHAQRPCIPASSFKGALLALARRAGLAPALQNKLFGAELAPDQTQAGAVEFGWLYAAPGSLPASSGLPLFGQDGHPHVAHLPHVSRNRDTGAAEAQRLFLQQVLPPGVSFGFECTARGLDSAEVSALLGLLALAGHPEHGLRLGAGQAADQGRVEWQAGETRRLDSLAEVWKALNLLNPSSGAVASAAQAPSSLGALTPVTLLWSGTRLSRPQALPATPLAQPQAGWLTLPELALQFHSPFLIYQRRRKAEGSGEPDGAPRTNHQGRAVLPASSLHGALRSQAERILRTIGHETPAGYAVPGVSGLAGLGGAAGLDLASVLFGAAGWRSLLRCSDFTDDGQSQDITHHMLAIDRLTGGGKDSAKFAIAVRDCPTLRGTLALDLARLHRLEPHAPGVSARVLGLLAHVLRDLDEGDIPLGYGASKGYGQQRSRTAQALAAALQGVAARQAGAPTLTDALQAFAALSAPPATEPPAAWPGLAVGPLAAEPALSPPPAPVAAEPRFHNPYVFIPFGTPRPDDPRLPWVDQQALREGRAAHHSHARYHAEALHGRLVCRVRATTPIFIGAGDVPGTSDPREQRNYRLGEQLAIPATTLRGLVSSLHESITTSALRVMTQRHYSVRATTPQALQHVGELVNRQSVGADGKTRTFLKVRDVDSGHEYPIRMSVMERLHDLADERTLAMKEQNGDAATAKVQPEVKPKGVKRNASPDKYGNKARLTAGQKVFFDLTADGQNIAEIAWSQIWRKQVETAPQQPWRTAHGLPGQGASLAPLVQAVERALSPSELLFGVVQVREAVAKATAARVGVTAQTAPPVMAWSSKVRFSAATAIATPHQELRLDELVTLKILSSPKPPSPALYLQTVLPTRDSYISKANLCQKPDQYQFKGRKAYLHALRDLKTDVPVVCKYNDQGMMDPKGYWPWQSNTKLPPSQSATRNAREKGEPQPDPNKQKVRVRPIASGSEFVFEIDFFNLSQAELETLCACLRPHPNFEHKIGMGKPIGLGSVKIEPVGLFLVDRQLRYRKIDISDAQRDHALWQRDASEGGIPSAQAAPAVAPDLLARAQMQRLQANAPEVYRALILTGSPHMVRQPVHYPQVVAGNIEQETYAWFVENDRIGLQTGRQGLDRFTAESNRLPELKRMGKSRP